VGSLSDPVTTDPNSASAEGGEIEGPALSEGKSMATIIRRPQNSFAFGFESYISGYVDGEGCFTVSISKRKGMVTGWELRPSFSVSQNHDRAEPLYMMKDYFDCGTIRPDRSDNTIKYEVRSLQQLVLIVIPHFAAYPLLSAKQKSFEVFRDICLEMDTGNHLLTNYIQSMLERAETINHNGKRKYRFGKI
jgi:hypothetical protein